MAKSKVNEANNYTKPELRKALYKKIKASSKGGDSNEWSARKGQILSKEYEAKGGGYKSGTKSKPQKNLSKWTKEEWMTSGTASNNKKGSSKEVKSEGTKRYLPKKAWSALSSEEKTKTNLAKKKGNASGKQFVSQPKSIKEKVKKFR